MTDVMSEAFGRELVGRTAFEKEAVWLPLLATHLLNAGEPVIRGKTFTDCVIEGPALIAIMDGVVLEGCNLGAVKDPKSLFYKAHGPVLVGAIGVAETRFIRCRFVQIGFTGQSETVDAMAADLVSAQDASQAGQV